MPNRLSRFCDGVMEACWLMALVLAPLFFNTYSSRVFEPDKIALVRSLALVALAAWLVKLIAEGGPRYEHAPPGLLRSFAGWRQVPMLLPVAALTIIYIIASALSVAPNISLFGSYQRMQGLFSTLAYIALFAAVAANLRRRAQVERLLTTVAVTSLPVSAFGILQRYQLDPLPWGGDTVERVTGHMGNAIFLGAYLIMATMIVLGRVTTSFRAVMTSSERLVLHTFRAAIYVFILALNLVAIWFTQSRGPQLGLLAGLFFFFVLLALHYRVRWLVLTTVGLGTVLAVFLVVLNIPNGPLASLAEMRGINRLARVLDEVQGNTGTGRVRVLIWTGVVEMITPHEPLQQPDGTPDAWNAIRPLVGYGPEAMLIAYNRFYPPELGQLEARNASPDRSHNETFDALAFTGVLGLVAHLSLFVALFYYSLKWLGLIDSARRRNVFLLLVLGGGVVSTIAFVWWQGPQFFGVSLPFGMVLGLIAFLTLYALLPARADGVKIESWRAVILIALIAAIVAHFTEVHFGIAIVSTRTHFWIFVGVLLVLGWVFPQMQDANVASAAPATAAPPTKTRASRRRAAVQERAVPDDLIPVGLTLGLLSVVLITLGFNFITNQGRAQDAFSVVWNALTLLPVKTGGVRPSFGVLGLILLTWGMGGALCFMEEARDGAARRWLSGLAASLGLALLVMLLTYVIFGSVLARAATSQPRSVDEIILSVGGLIPLFYSLMALALIGWAWALNLDSPAPRTRTNPAAAAWLGYLGLPVLAVVLSITLNMQVILADVAYKIGLQFEDAGRSDVAIQLFQRTLELAPSQDFYYLFLGRAYLNASNSVSPEERDQLFRTAEEELHNAREINPLNTDHTANLGRLNRQWAFLAPTPELRAERARKADEFYVQALRLSPNNVGLWNEWAALQFQLLGNAEKAQEYLTHSLSLDDTFDQTYQFWGDYYVWEAQRQTDAARQQEFYAKAVEAYEQGVQAGEQYRSTSALALRLGLATVYVNTNQVQPAIQEYLKVAELNAGAGQWQVYRALAELYRQSGDLVRAREYGQQALNAAPESEKAALQNWLDALP